MSLTPGSEIDDAGSPSVRPADEERADHITALVLARIEQTIEHLHMPMAVPSASEAEALKEKAPEVYNLWLRLAEKKADDDAALQRAPFDHPLALAKRGQWFGITATVAVLALCGYLASLGGAGPYIGGVLAAFNLVAIIGAFMAKGRGNPSG